jgi:hypothetical protein
LPPALTGILELHIANAFGATGDAVLDQLGRTHLSAAVGAWLLAAIPTAKGGGGGGHRGILTLPACSSINSRTSSAVVRLASCMQTIVRMSRSCSQAEGERNTEQNE